MASALHCLSSSCLSIQSKFKSLTLDTRNNKCSRQLSLATFRGLSFSNNLSHNVFSSNGYLTMGSIQRPSRLSVVCEAAPNRKPDSAAKRARQAEKRRLYNKAKKSEVKTRMKKVLEALDVLRKKPEAQSDEVLPIEKLIAEAYSAIDKAVKAGSLHRNTGARRKSRLARRKKAIEIHHGWYRPAAAAATTEVTA